MAVEVDFGLEFSAAMGSKLDNIHDCLKKTPPQPLQLAFTGSDSVSEGAGVIRIGRPPVGRIWNITSVTVTGADDHTAVTGVSVALYVDSDPANLGLGQARVVGLALPSYQFISRGTLWAHSTGDVCANIQGSGAGGQQVNVSIGVAEWREGDVTSHTGR